jgi:hypothetical protein
LKEQISTAVGGAVGRKPRGRPPRVAGPRRKAGETETGEPQSPPAAIASPCTKFISLAEGDAGGKRLMV